MGTGRHSERYPDGGLVPLRIELVENLDPATGGILGQAPRVDPFRTLTINQEPAVDLSDELLKRLEGENFEALISAVGNQRLEILYKLHLKGLHTVCIPQSVEKDIASTAISFGFNTVLSATIEMLNKAYQAARSARKVAVVEVLGVSRPVGLPCRPALPSVSGSWEGFFLYCLAITQSGVDTRMHTT